MSLFTLKSIDVLRLKSINILSYAEKCCP